MSKIKLVIKPTQGDSKYTVEAERTWTVADLKGGVAKEADITVEDQKLIYKGKILKDEDVLQDLGLDDEHVVHLVKRKTNSTNAPSTTPPPATAAPVQAASESTGPSVPGLGPGAMGGLGGFPPLGTGLSDQSATALFNSPLMQQVMDNPELIRTLLQSNPTIRQLMESNPEFAQILNNPQMLRESLQVASNPALLREQMRNQDRAMSNIEAHPEGFNALRRMYENFQEPLMSAATGEANPFAALFQGAGGGGQGGIAGNGTAPASNTDSQAGGAPNSQPLPNPWAPTGAAPAGAAGAGRGLYGGMPDLGSLGGLGGMPGLGGGGDVNSMVQALQNPQMNQMMQQLMQQPGVLEAAISQNPHMRQLMEGDPRIRETFQNPDMIRRLLDPENLRAMAQMQQAMQQLSAAGLGPDANQLGGAAGGLGDFGLGGLGGFGGLGGVPPMLGGGPAVANPQQFYSSELQQLQDMGFSDQQANIRALQANHGDVSAAVAYLIDRGANLPP
eukprot:jgi/Botrbrau1/329/Bobra.0022s0286.1